MDSDKLKVMNMSETAVYENVTRMTIDRRIKRGQFPKAIEICGKIGWTKEYIEEFRRIQHEKAIQKLAA